MLIIPRRARSLNYKPRRAQLFRDAANLLACYVLNCSELKKFDHDHFKDIMSISRLLPNTDVKIRSCLIASIAFFCRAAKFLLAIPQSCMKVTADVVHLLQTSDTFTYTQGLLFALTMVVGVIICFVGSMLQHTDA